MKLPLKKLMLAMLCMSSAIMVAQNKVLIYSPHPSAGLHAALQKGNDWKHLGQLCSSDYGTWGAEKKMYNPTLCRANDGTWRLVFQVNTTSPCVAVAYGLSLVTWRPQDYALMKTKNCLEPVVRAKGKDFEIQFVSDGKRYGVKADTDFRRFSKEQLLADDQAFTVTRVSASVDGKEVKGQVFDLNDNELLGVREYFTNLANDADLSSERMYDDAKTFEKVLDKDDPTVFGILDVDMRKEKVISDKLIGIFFEDISYAADGGLYAELIQNRDFEYSGKDRRGWHATTAWHASEPIRIATTYPLTPQNPHYAILQSDTIVNEGWDGIAVERGKTYDFSMFIRGQKLFEIALLAEDGSVIARSQLKSKTINWQRYETTLVAQSTCSKARLAVIPIGKDEVAVDMISLFPRDTFKNRKNGLRKDLAETIAALHPKFVRFPGGCMSHGQGLDNIYHWNHTVGPLESRTPDKNIWNYHQTRGLGFYEYFQFCEDIGAEPLPVLAAGVPCQNSANNADGLGGQQGGIPMADMPAYIDELCHLIEWANGNPQTNKWAKMRADAGHPEPFNLKYLGIGNEDIISTVFEERYEMICKMMHLLHPEIKICGTVGPFHFPSADYIEGWDFTKKHPQYQYMTDEHYYESTGWFMYHRDYYDNYDRKAPKVYLGEWAASTKVKRPNLETALAEALYLTDIERNGDVVEMTSYAPMLCKDGHSNWNPNMIYFDNTTVRTTPAYEIQRLFSVCSGNRYISSTLKLDHQDLDYRVGASVVRDSKSGSCYLKLVNALPATLKLTVKGVKIPQNAKCYQFTGKSVEDQHAKAEYLEVSDPTILPPYSFRIIKL
ncbi:alpha-N-arabinofuranosidase [Prevotella sp. E13-17]|uniref:alpha-L-arabinofuranosidase C-terminal domain-containing protein n=1 Tax=Prevotella sp. E13-17 TaxID=2913616 RepID=UPI001EDA0F6D|nr:alpha-L-arabinofuranosidase C-terminal domain-containing protein [Prevotella sp. E13-17]UKK50901.1 alpha-N-arabinofuranosidase [Prevotella sp. E13-17]